MTSKRAIYRLEALKNWFKEDSEQYMAMEKAIEALQRVESVGEKTDCVEVVRCKDCEHNDSPPERGNANCNKFYGMTDQYGFCHLGDKR